MLSLQKYLNDPCGTASLPYWKCKRLEVPNNMTIIHDRNFCASDLKGYLDEPYFRLYNSLKKVNLFQQNGFEIIFGAPDINLSFGLLMRVIPI